MHVEVAEPPHELLHGVDVVVDTPLQDGLVAHADAALHQFVEGAAAEGCDFARVVEMRVQRDFLVDLAPRFDNPR